MVNQTTFSTGLRVNKTKSTGPKMVDSKPEILKIPQNLYLLAETRVDTVGLHDVVQEANQVLLYLEQVGTKGIHPPMTPHFKDRLCKEIDAGEALLNKCQKNSDKLVNLYSGSCNNTHIHQLTADLSSCREEFIRVKERGHCFLPDKNLRRRDQKVNHVTETERVPDKKRIKLAPQPLQAPAKDKREY